MPFNPIDVMESHSILPTPFQKSQMENLSLVWADLQIILAFLVSWDLAWKFSAKVR